MTRFLKRVLFCLSLAGLGSCGGASYSCSTELIDSLANENTNMLVLKYQRNCHATAPFTYSVFLVNDNVNYSDDNLPRTDRLIIQYYYAETEFLWESSKKLRVDFFPQVSGRYVQIKSKTMKLDGVEISHRFKF